MAVNEVSAPLKSGPDGGRPSAAGTPPQTAADGKPATLDDIMIAMDVVDTMRHREDLVARELNETGREAELIARLKEIYREQGIDVPDQVLAEGVKALKESRFTYTPPPAGWKRSLLTAWATRRRWGKVAAVALTALLGSCGVHYWNVTRPANLVEAQARIEVTQTLPNAIRQAHGDILKAATDPAVRQKADPLLSDGERAIRDKDRAAMTGARASLQALLDEVTRDYTLTIVSRPGETSGVWRRPPKAGQARNYYLVVEALGADGRPQRLPIRNEETGQIETVEKFGVRVPQAVFDSVGVDKRDDGIIQRNKFGHKRRGTLNVDYAMPYEGGMITRW
jgi:Family of unknown function (DUF6384)